MPTGRIFIWLLAAVLALGAGVGMAHKTADGTPLQRSAHVADYDDDDDDPIYWEHDDDEGGPWEEVVLSPLERQTIVNFYRSWRPGPEYRRQPPPGLQKRAHFGGELPPGWQSRVQRQHMISTDIYSGAYSIPAELLRQLPPQPAGTHLVEVGNRIARIYNNTRRVADYVDY